MQMSLTFIELNSKYLFFYNLHHLYCIASGKVTDVGSLKDADSAWDCFELLQQEDLFTLNDVIFMQFLLEKTDCNDLNAKCIDYAKEQTALCYFIKPPGRLIFKPC